MSAAPKKYQFSPPQFIPGHTVYFKDHRGANRVGLIMWVETRYNRDLVGYHVYAIRRKGHKRCLHIGEGSIW